MYPSFFKVLSNMDYTTTLRLPPAFLKKYESDLTGNVKLRSDSGRFWNVKMERNGQYFVCFTRGWQKFAEDAALKLGELLVFSLFDNSEFDVQIYKTNFCERRLPPLPTATATATASTCAKKKTVAKSVSGSTKEIINPLYFETCLKEHQKSRLNIPIEFARAAGLGLGSRRHVKLEYVKNKRSKMVLVDNERAHISRVDLAKGWPKFREANGLVYGNIYSFEFCPTLDAILVKELK